MILSEEQKENITKDLDEWTEKQYGDKTLKERQKLGMFFTPAALVIKMIEKFTDLDDDILDPTAGSGNLIVGCILAGADPKRCFANELDKDTYNLLVERLTKYNVPKENITNFDVFSADFRKKYMGFKFGVK